MRPRCLRGRWDAISKEVGHAACGSALRLSQSLLATRIGGEAGTPTRGSRPTTVPMLVVALRWMFGAEGVGCEALSDGWRPKSDT